MALHVKGSGPVVFSLELRINPADFVIIKLVLRFLKNVPYFIFVFPEYIPLFYPSLTLTLG